MRQRPGAFDELYDADGIHKTDRASGRGRKSGAQNRRLVCVVVRVDDAFLETTHDLEGQRVQQTVSNIVLRDLTCAPFECLQARPELRRFAFGVVIEPRTRGATHALESVRHLLQHIDRRLRHALGLDLVDMALRARLGACRLPFMRRGVVMSRVMGKSVHMTMSVRMIVVVGRRMIVAARGAVHVLMPMLVFVLVRGRVRMAVVVAVCVDMPMVMSVPVTVAVAVAVSMTVPMVMTVLVPVPLGIAMFVTMIVTVLMPVPVFELFELTMQGLVGRFQ